MHVLMRIANNQRKNEKNRNLRLFTFVPPTQRSKRGRAPMPTRGVVKTLLQSLTGRLDFSMYPRHVGWGGVGRGRGLPLGNEVAFVVR